MARPKTGKRKLVEDIVRKYHSLPDKSISKYILNNYGDIFNNDLEHIRGIVRRITGKSGSYHRENLDKTLFKDAPSMPLTWRKVRTPYKLVPGLWLVIADLHVPFHEPKPIESAIQAAQAEKVDGVVVLGDFMDCASLSYWPTAKRDFNREVESTVQMLDFLRHEFPKQLFVYKPGNHEYRLLAYLIRNAPELAESVLGMWEIFFGFEDRKIEFLEYFQKVYAGKLPMIHGHELRGLTTAVNAARGLFLKTNHYALCAHYHSTSTHPERSIEGIDLTCHSIGCLCDLSPDYSPFNTRWNHGFAIVYIEKDGNFEVVNRRILPNGKVV